MTSEGSSEELWRLERSFTGGSGNSQENQNGAVQPNNILVTQTAHLCSHLSFWNRCNLIHHQSTLCSQSIALAGLDKEPKKGSIGWIGRKGAHNNRIGPVETVI
jgi:hypothetical protein